MFCFELSKLFVNSSATDIVLVILSSTAVERAIAQCTSRWAMARVHRLNTSMFWRRSTVSPVFFGRSPRSSLSLSRPLPTLSPSLIGHLASVDVKQHERKAASLFPQCPCRGRLFVCCCGRCSCLHEPVSSYFSKACCSVVSY